MSVLGGLPRRRNQQLKDLSHCQNSVLEPSILELAKRLLNRQVQRKVVVSPSDDARCLKEFVGRKVSVYLESSAGRFAAPTKGRGRATDMFFAGICFRALAAS